MTGSGPLCYVQLVQSPKVDNPKPSTSKATPDIPPPSSSSSSPKSTKTLAVAPATEPSDEKKKEGGDIYQDMPELVTSPSKKKSQPDTKTAPVVKTALSSKASPTTSSPGSGSSPQGGVGGGTGGANVIRDDEARRLCSETRRILLGHQEHAMTLTELSEHFMSVGDPTSPSSQVLYRVLQKQTTGSEARFEVRVSILL